jgi:hypothetical protein
MRDGRDGVAALACAAISGLGDAQLPHGCMAAEVRLREGAFPRHKHVLWQ